MIVHTTMLRNVAVGDRVYIASNAGIVNDVKIDDDAYIEMEKSRMVKFAELNPKELRRYQLKLAEMMSFFNDVCNKNHLTYYLTEGSCLGAVRHNGFIPWDDDLDIAMPRKDYEMLWEMWNKEYSKSGYVLCRTTQEQCIKFHIMQLRDSSTTCIYSHSTDIDICHGIKIDICPLDGVPENRIKQILQTIDTKVFGLFAAQRVPNQEGTSLTKVIAKLLLSVVRSPKLRYELWKGAENRFRQYDFDTSIFVRCLNAHPLRKDIFGTPKFVSFENYSFSIPEKYDEYLKNRYGDYMRFPPEEDRKPQTVVACFDLDNCYLFYKGKEYLFK